MREHHTTFIIGIGGALRSGKPHDGRSPDYDDWTMNGDILFWNELLDCAFELSSMGIRVDPESLDRQLTIAGVTTAASGLINTRCACWQASYRRRSAAASAIAPVHAAARQGTYR